VVIDYILDSMDKTIKVPLVLLEDYYSPRGFILFNLYVKPFYFSLHFFVIKGCKLGQLSRTNTSWALNIPIFSICVYADESKRWGRCCTYVYFVLQ
jgi:hypothetical protein